MKTTSTRLKDNQDAEHYILSIRNKHKQAYAGAYYGYLVGLIDHRPDPAGLSYMAAQAVRMRLDVIIG